MRSTLLRIGRATWTQPSSSCLPFQVLDVGSRLRHFSAYAASSSCHTPPDRMTRNESIFKGGFSFGQPTHASHPEFFSNPLDVLPGISKNELKERRTRLCSLASRFSQRRHGKDFSHMIIIPAASKKYMTENIPYPFRQDSNFYYLTGSCDPETLLVLTISKDGKQEHSLFLNDPDPMTDLWDGKKTSPKAATELLGLDQAYFLSNLESFIREFSVKTDKEFLIWCEDRRMYEQVRKLFPLGSDIPPVQSPKGLLHSLRVIKSPGEVELMRKSAQIASEAFSSAINFSSRNIQRNIPVSEHQIWAKIDYECRIRGADRLAYPPVVASGSRANIIHYVHNSNLCGPDDLCLVDAGCEFFGYVSDITRTFPVSGKFTNDRQRSLYELVLQVQQELIPQVEPGMTLDRLFRFMGPIMLKGLQELGILTTTIDATVGSTETMLRFCPHHVSHYLGMDVHDTSSIERHEILQPGMVITVEPGIYIQSSPAQENLLTKVGKEFEGIGIRIEDDVLVTPSGQEVLTAPCPKTVSDIEWWGRQ